MYELTERFEVLNNEELVAIDGGGDILDAIWDATVEGVKGFVETIDPIVIRPVKIVASVANYVKTGDPNALNKAAWYLDQY